MCFIDRWEVVSFWKFFVSSWEDRSVSDRCPEKLERMIVIRLQGKSYRAVEVGYRTLLDASCANRCSAGLGISVFQMVISKLFEHQAPITEIAGRSMRHWSLWHSDCRTVDISSFDQLPRFTCTPFLESDRSNHSIQTEKEPSQGNSDSSPASWLI